MAITQTRYEPVQVPTWRSRSEGKARSEVLRCLKRHLSNVVYRRLISDAQKRLTHRS